MTRQFAKAFNAIEIALSEAVAENLTMALEPTVTSGVSADLCQSLAKLADNDAGTEVSITWSPRETGADD